MLVQGMNECNNMIAKIPLQKLIKTAKEHVPVHVQKYYI